MSVRGAAAPHRRRGGRAWSRWPRSSCGCRGGAALGFAEAGESIDARLQDLLSRAGVRRPRIWIAAAEASLSLAVWWIARLGERAASGDGLGERRELEAWPAPSAVELFIETGAGYRPVSLGGQPDDGSPLVG